MELYKCFKQSVIKDVFKRLRLERNKPSALMIVARIRMDLRNRPQDEYCEEFREPEIFKRIMRYATYMRGNAQ